MLSRVEIVRQALRKIVPMLAERKVQVTQQGMNAYVEWGKDGRPRRVNLPVLPDNASEKLIAAVQGFLDHEVAHILFTSFKNVDSAVKMGCGKLHNITEDVQIEKNMRKIYRGSAQNLDSVWRYVHEELTIGAFNKAVASGNEEQIRGALLVVAIHAWGGQQVAKDFMDDGDKWQHLKPYMKILGDDVIKEIGELDDSDAALRIAARMKARVEEYKREQEEKRREKERKEKEEREARDKEREKERTDEDSDDTSTSESGDEPAPSDDGEDDEDAADDSSDSPSDEAGGSDEDEDDDDDSDEDEDDDDSDEDDDDDDSDEDDDDDSDEEDKDGDDKEGDDDSDAGDDDSDAGDEHEGDRTPPPGSDDDDDEEGESEATGPDELTGDVFHPEGEQDDEPVDSKVTDELTESLDAMQDLDDVMNRVINKSLGEALSSGEYVSYTRDWDVIEKFDPKMPQRGRSRVPTDDQIQDFYTRMENKSQSVCGLLQKHLERMIAARSRSRYVPGYRSGKLNTNSLHRLMTNDDRVFKRRHISRTKDVALSLVIDCSGSMSGEKIKLAMLCGYALSSVLDRMNIKHEAIGFTTTDYAHVDRKDVERMYEEMRTSGRVGKMRAEPIYMPIFKPFNERLSVERRRAMASAPNSIALCQNIDGESIEIAAERLLSQKAERHIMIVLSDGCPASGCMGMGFLAKHLKSVIEGLRDKGVETFGIGIMTNEVEEFYPNRAVVGSLEDLPTTVMHTLERMLLGN